MANVEHGFVDTSSEFAYIGYFEKRFRNFINIRREIIGTRRMMVENRTGIRLREARIAIER